MDPNINSNGIYSFLKRPKLLQHREIRLFYIEFLNVVNPHFPDATPHRKIIPPKININIV